MDPRYTGGEPVRIAYAQHQAEAEMIQGLLLEEGIPSMLRRSGGFDVPDFLAAGPRDVLVPSSAEEAARDLLLSAEMPDVIAVRRDAEGPVLFGRHLAVGAAVLAAAFFTALIAWLLLEVAP